MRDYRRMRSRASHQKHKHKIGKFICHLCGAVMVRSARYYHLKNVHKIGAEEHKCDLCGKITLSKYHHKEHLRTHSDEKPYVCPHCGRTFKNKVSLETCARRCTGLGVFECSTCSRTFTAKDRLRHHEMLHQGIRPHACPICNLTYTRKSNMTGHVKRVHKRNLVDILAEIKTKKEEKIDHLQPS